MATMQLATARAALLAPAARRWGVCSLRKSSLRRETGRFHDGRRPLFSTVSGSMSTDSVSLSALFALSCPSSSFGHDRRYRSAHSSHNDTNYQIAHLSTSTSSTTTDTDSNINPENIDPPPKDEMEFQAETRQLLDIVTHSLYTDKEVFLRELVSNASDALEKLRHIQATGTLSGTATSTTAENEDDVPLEIRITTDEASNTLTITDTGIGMTKREMISNLGTIARSGSKAFVEGMKIKKALDDASDLDPLGQGIIGKFGVGFYSGFMVADQVDVRSKSAGKVADDNSTNTTDDHHHHHPAFVWESTGTGKYSISPLSPDIRQDRGTSVVLHLKPEMAQYSNESTVESILKKYSNFVGFPIFLNGNRVNTMDAIWLQDPKSVEEEKHSEFYKYVSHMHDEPLSTIHFRVDAPLDIKALFYIPSFHQEKYGMGRMESGVSLYSRKILIEAKCLDILPEWCRFIKGVVDSEDLPLSISREKPQDSALVGKMRKALTRKIISHLTTMMK
jgi:TNF receptor-associated protein 1